MSNTLQGEIDRITNRAIELGKVKDASEITTEINSYGATWITVPNVHGKGRSATFTILSNEDGTIFDTVSNKIGQ